MTEKEIVSRFDLACNLVSEGHEIALEYQDHITPKVKEDAFGVRAIVTEADITIENQWRDFVKEIFPQDQFVGEEGTNDLSRSKTPAWCGDPIDGTTNYSQGSMRFGNSLAILKNGVPVAGAMMAEGNLYATHMYMDGILRNGKPFTTPADTGSNELMVIAECLDFIKEKGVELEKELRSCIPNEIQTWFGSAICACADIIERKNLAAFVHAGLALWDHAFVALLLPKAGATITRWNGTHTLPHIWHQVSRSLQKYRKNEYQFDMVAAFPEMHGKLLSLLQPYASIREEK